MGNQWGRELYICFTSFSPSVPQIFKLGHKWKRVTSYYCYLACCSTTKWVYLIYLPLIHYYSVQNMSFLTCRDVQKSLHDLSVLQLALVHLCKCYIQPTIFYVHIKTIKKVPLFPQSRSNQLQGIGTRKVNYATWFLLMLTSDWDRIEWERTAYFAQQTKNNQDSRYRLNHSIMGTEPVS